jgi:hypothetical protein
VSDLLESARLGNELLIFGEEEEGARGPALREPLLDGFLEGSARVRVSEGGGESKEASRDVVLVVDPGTVADLSEIKRLIFHELDRGVVLTLEREDGGQDARP